MQRSVPLHQQIDATERRLALCYGASSVQASALKARVGHALRSPWALLAVAGAVFAIVRLRTKRVVPPAVDRVPNDPLPHAALLRIVSSAVPALFLMWQQFGAPPPAD